MTAPMAAADFQRMRSAKLGTLRVDFLWSKVEPTAGAPRDWSFYDQLVGRAARAHVSIMAVLVGSPAFAAESEAYVPATAAGRAGFSRFVRDVVRRYGHGGRFWRLHRKLPRRPLSAYQIWNEPNYPPHWSNGASRRRGLRRLPEAAGERDPALRPPRQDRPGRAAGQLHARAGGLPLPGRAVPRARGQAGLRRGGGSPIRRERGRGGGRALAHPLGHAQQRGRPHAGVDLGARLGHRRGEPLLQRHARRPGRPAQVRLPLRGAQPGALPREPARVVQLAGPERPRSRGWEFYCGLFDTSGNPKPSWSAFRRFTRATR